MSAYCCIKLDLLLTLNHDARSHELKKIYRVSIKSFPDYKHLLQENYVEYKHMQL